MIDLAAIRADHTRKADGHCRACPYDTYPCTTVRLCDEMVSQRLQIAGLTRAIEEELDERDRAVEWADKLAYAIAPQSVIGEHSSMNNPWVNALEQAERLHARVDELTVEHNRATAARYAPVERVQCEECGAEFDRRDGWFRMTALPPSIDATGQTDASHALNEWLATLGSGATADLGNAVLRCDHTVWIRNKWGLTLTGNGAQLLQNGDGRGEPTVQVDNGLVGPRERCVLRVQDSIGVKVLPGITIKGANPNAGTGDPAYVKPLEAQHGIWIDRSVYVSVDSTIIGDVYGDFVYVSGSQYVQVHDTTCGRNGRQGMAFADTQHLRVVRNRISDTRFSMFDIEQAPQMTTRDVSIADNICGKHRLTFFSAVGLGGVLDQVYIDHNALSAFGVGTIGNGDMEMLVYSPDGSRRHDFYVRNNVSTTVRGGDHLFNFAHIDGLTVTGNYQRCGPRVVSPVQAPDCTNITEGMNTWA